MDQTTFEKRCDAFTAMLLENGFDSVQVVATSTHHNGTTIAHRGAGNWYARAGAVREWLVKNDERTRAQVRAEND